MKSPCCSVLIGVFPVFDQGSWQKFSYASNSRWHKLKRDQIRPKRSSQPKLILGYPPWIIINCTIPNMQISANLDSSVTENELFMIIKLDVGRSAEFHFPILFFHGSSQSVRPRDYEVREHIPHTWASSHNNLFQSNFSSARLF